MDAKELEWIRNKRKEKQDKIAFIQRCINSGHFGDIAINKMKNDILCLQRRYISNDKDRSIKKDDR